MWILHSSSLSTLTSNHMKSWDSSDTSDDLCIYIALVSLSWILQKSYRACGRKQHGTVSFRGFLIVQIIALVDQELLRFIRANSHVKNTVSLITAINGLCLQSLNTQVFSIYNVQDIEGYKHPRRRNSRWSW